MRLAPAGVGTLLMVSLAGCAYFNGLYNANRLASGARTAEREGRTGEARSLWTQAAAKAESVAVRYPESRYRDDALLLRGRALIGADGCRDATAPLRAAVDESPDPVMRFEARLALGECLVRIGAPDSAVEVLRRALDSTAASGFEEVWLWLGKAELARGRAGRAVRALERADPARAAFDLARAHGGRGDPRAAEAVLAARTPGPYDESEWARALDALGSLDRTAARRVVDRLLERSRLTAGERARLLMADGERCLGAGAAEDARARFVTALEAAPDAVEGAIARARVALMDLRSSGSPDDLPLLLTRFEAAVEAGGTPARLVAAYLPVLREATAHVRQSPEALGEFRLLAVAEALRDSAHAGRMAASLFLEAQRRYPASAFAPKALIAAAGADPGRAAEIRELLLRDYAASPYTRVVLGESDPRFAQLEDSLATALAVARARGWIGPRDDEGGSARGGT